MEKKSVSPNFQSGMPVPLQNNQQSQWFHMKPAPSPSPAPVAAQPPDVILPSYEALANGLVDRLESRMAAHLNEIRRELAADVARLLKQGGGGDGSAS